MRLTNWLLGIVLGAFAGGSALVVGAFAFLLAVPALVWASREVSRPAGLAGLLLGAGLGQAGLFAFAEARCAGSNQAAAGVFESCSSPDLIPYLAVAGVLVALGIAMSIIVTLRRRQVAG
jgi:hypothetical protein